MRRNPAWLLLTLGLVGFIAAERSTVGLPDASAQTVPADSRVEGLRAQLKMLRANRERIADRHPQAASLDQRIADTEAAIQTVAPDLGDANGGVQSGIPVAGMAVSLSPAEAAALIQLMIDRIERLEDRVRRLEVAQQRDR